MGLNVRTGKPFKYGLKGSSDIIGITNDGKFLAIEAKTGAATQSKEQKNFAAMIKNFGGRYFVCRTPEEAVNFVKHCFG